MFVYKSELRVQWFDTDLADVVYFGNYFRYFTTAEDDFLLSIGLGFRLLKEKFNIGFARVYAECHFKRAARYEDIIEVELEPKLEDQVHLFYGFRIFRKAGRVLLAEGKVRAVCVPMEGKFKAIRIPKEVFNRLNKAIEGDG